MVDVAPPGVVFFVLGVADSQKKKKLFLLA